MNVLEGLTERIRRGERIPWPVSLALSAVTPVVRAGMIARLHLPRTRVDARVISFGNLTAGGTGKTPAVIERARKEIAGGGKVAILTRGYGSKEGSAQVWNPGKLVDVPFLCRTLGDEPALIALKVPEAVIVKNGDRVAGAQMAVEQYGCDTLIMDDGFQYVCLERDENILLIDALNPFGNGHLIPRGLLREPLPAMARATAILLTHCDQAGDLSPVLSRVGALAPHAPIRRTRHAPVGFFRFLGGARPADLRGKPPLPCTAVAGKQVRVVCGIGHPESMFNTLEDLGAVLIERITVPDHGEIAIEALDTSQSHVDIIVTTEKDAVRMQGSEFLGKSASEIWVLVIELNDLE